MEACSVVHDHAHLIKQLESVFQRYQMPILVEEFIEGMELHVSVLGNDPPVALPLIEYDFSKLTDDHPPVITYDIKWNPLAPPYHHVDSICPARIDKKTEKRVREHALRAYKATYCRDYARIDLRVDAAEQPMEALGPSTRRQRVAARQWVGVGLCMAGIAMIAA